MSGGYISLFNGSTVFSDAELQNALPDFQSQVSGEFNWYWGFDAYLDINGGGTPLVVVDLPGPNDPQGALGYHWIDANYQPYAVIFAGLCQQYGVPVTGVISHELLEMLADQLADTCALYDYGDGYGVIVLQEVCDPVEQNIYYEGPNGNLVSDFATPAWYAPGDPNGPYDFLGVVAGPWQLASGGYVSYQVVSLPGWQQAFGDKAQEQLAKAAEALRRRTMSGDARVEVLRELGAERGAAAEPREPVPTAERRQQPAQQAGTITVVERKDVPKTPQVGRRGKAQPAGVARRAVSGAGPKVQKVPAKS